MSYAQRFDYTAIIWPDHVVDLLQAAAVLMVQGLPAPAQVYYQQIAPCLTQQLPVVSNPALKKRMERLQQAIAQGNPQQQYQAGTLLLNYLQDQMAPRRYKTWFFLMGFILATAGFIAHRLAVPYFPKPDHQQYLMPVSKPLHRITTWLELGRSAQDMMNAKNTRHQQFPGETVELQGFEPVQWEDSPYLSPPTVNLVNWAMQVTGRQQGVGRMIVRFPAQVGPAGVTAVSLFMSDGDLSTYPRVVALKTNQQRVLSAPAPHGEWVEFQLTPEEQAAGEKTIDLVRVAGLNPAVSAVIFWHGR